MISKFKRIEFEPDGRLRTLMSDRYTASEARRMAAALYSLGYQLKLCANARSWAWQQDLPILSLIMLEAATGIAALTTSATLTGTLYFMGLSAALPVLTQLGVCGLVVSLGLALMRCAWVQYQGVLAERDEADLVINDPRYGFFVGLWEDIVAWNEVELPKLRALELARRQGLANGPKVEAAFDCADIRHNELKRKIDLAIGILAETGELGACHSETLDPEHLLAEFQPDSRTNHDPPLLDDKSGDDLVGGWYESAKTRPGLSGRRD